MANGLKRKAVQNLMTSPFDPEGSGYDYESAKSAGLKPDPKTKHWSSRNPQTGQMLKGRKHPTWKLGVKEDLKLGYRLVKKNGKYYTIPTKRVKRNNK